MNQPDRIEWNNLEHSGALEDADSVWCDHSACPKCALIKAQLEAQKPSAKFKVGDIVHYEYKEIRQADVISVRRIEFGDGSGVYKYKLSDGRELVGSALTKVGEV